MQQPREIKRVEGKGLKIVWNDGAEHHLSSTALRKNCPCAGCREARGEGESHEKPLTGKKKSALRIIENSMEQEIDLKRIWGIGQYALGIEWGDGHDTGIYTFELLRELGGRA